MAIFRKIRKWAAKNIVILHRIRNWAKSYVQLWKGILPLIVNEYRMRVGDVVFKISSMGEGFCLGSTCVDNYGCYEIAMSQKVLDSLREDAVFVDIGAGPGYYSVLASQVVQPDNIHAFEPDPYNLALLELNNRKYCGERIRINRQYVGKRSDGGEVVTLDDYCFSNGIVPDVIKMDIDGSECDAIAGMLGVLAEYKPVLLMEFHERILREDFGIDATQARQAIRQIEELGYTLKYNGHHYHTNTHGGVPDKEWVDMPPNNVNYAVLGFVL